MRRAALLGLVGLLAGCGLTLRNAVARVNNATVAAIDDGTRNLLAAYCAEQMRAIGREGRYAPDTAGEAHCVESGPRSGSAATDAERAALLAVRARWATPQRVANTVVASQRTLAAALRAEGRVEDGQLLSSLGDLARAYGELRQAATAAGIPAPPALSFADR